MPDPPLSLLVSAHLCFGRRFCLHGGSRHGLACLRNSPSRRTRSRLLISTVFFLALGKRRGACGDARSATALLEAGESYLLVPLKTLRILITTPYRQVSRKASQRLRAVCVDYRAFRGLPLRKGAPSWEDVLSSNSTRLRYGEGCGGAVRLRPHRPLPSPRDARGDPSSSIMP